MSLIRRPREWDRQPTEFVQVKSDLMRLGLVHALIPGLQDPRSTWDYARPRTMDATPGTINGNPIRVSQSGMVLQFHPNATETNAGGDNALKNIRFPAIVKPTDALSVIWCGYIDTLGGGGAPDGYGALWALGADNFGNGWGARQIVFNGNQLSAYYIDSSPAQYQTNLSTPLAQGMYGAFGYRKRAGSNAVTSLDCLARTSATTNQGNGVMRSSTVGFDLAGSGQNPPAFGGPATATGVNRVLAVLVFAAELTDEQFYMYGSMPWEAFAREPQFGWFPTVNGGGPPAPPYVGIRSGYKAGGVLYDDSTAQSGYRADGANRILVPSSRGYSIGGTKYTIT